MDKMISRLLFKIIVDVATTFLLILHASLGRCADGLSGELINRIKEGPGRIGLNLNSTDKKYLVQ